MMNEPSVFSFFGIKIGIPLESQQGFICDALKLYIETHTKSLEIAIKHNPELVIHISKCLKNAKAILKHVENLDIESMEREIKIKENQLKNIEQ